MPISNNWVNRASAQLVVNTDPADMTERYELVFVDGAGVPASNAEWIYDPDLTAVAGFASKYWTITGDVISLKSPAERTAFDDAEAAALVVTNRATTVAEPTVVEQFEGFRLRALVELFNERDNYLVNRISELQAALDAVKASSGPADNIRAAIPATWLATNTRTRAQAITDYTDDINAGGAD